MELKIQQKLKNTTETENNQSRADHYTKMWHQCSPFPKKIKIESIEKVILILYLHVQAIPLESIFPLISSYQRCRFLNFIVQLHFVSEIYCNQLQHPTTLLSSNFFLRKIVIIGGG